MKTFTVYRPNVPTDTHNLDQRNAPDQPQFQGVIFDTGKCVIQWLTVVGGISVWDSYDDMLRVHGHPEYGTYFVWNE
jgi:hypothetical protein